MPTFVPFFDESPTTPDRPQPFAAVVAQPSSQLCSVPGAVPAEPKTDPAPATCGQEPQVTLVHDQDAVTRIIVLCSCGQRLELDCLY